MTNQQLHDLLDSPELLTALADVQHEIWVSWMRHLFKVSIHNEDGTVTIPVEKVERWHRQIGTPYEELSEREQQGDIAQALKVLAMMKKIQ
ncbi:MAG: hypothetical protein AAF639_36550 [Chloroflexota bacterium]